MGIQSILIEPLKHKMPLVQICLAHRPNLVVTATGHSDGDKVELRMDRNGPMQIWDMKEDDGWCTFRMSQHDSKTLDFCEKSNKLQVWRHKMMGNKNQKWKVVADGGHKFIYAKEDKSSAYCFSCEGGAEMAGADVMVRKHIGADCQMFTIKSVMH